jgi:DNA-binding beta-propeller fold protein YncE
MPSSASGVSRREFSRFGAAAGLSALSACGPAPQPITAKAFVANSQGASISVIDLSLMTVIQRIPLPANPVQVFSRPDAAEVLALTEDGVLHSINVRTHAIFRAMPAVPRARQMALSALAPQAVVLGEKELGLIDLKTRAVRKLPLPGAPRSLDLSPETPLGLVTLNDRPEVHLFDRESARWTSVLKAPAREARFLKNGAQVLIGRRDDRVLTIASASTAETVVDLPLAITPDRFCFSGDLGQVFINGDGADSLAVVYPFQTEVAATLLAGHRPGAMGASRNPAFLFVANPAASSVTVVDVPTQRIVGAAPVGQEPGAIAVTPDDQFALVLNKASGDVAVLRTQAFTKIVRRDRSVPMFLMVPVGSAPVSCAFSYYESA